MVAVYHVTYWDGGKMSTTELELERLRRQKVLRDLNSRLTAGSKVELSITGSRIPVQGMTNYSVHTHQ